MLYYNLKSIFNARQITNPYTFLVKIGIAPHTATRILNNNMQVMRLNHIELICTALYCEPNDLLAYKTDSNNPLPKEHPLLNLIPLEIDNNWQQQLKTMPISKLREVSKMLSDQTETTTE